ncbi:MAG: hypothetical protein H7Y12_08640, partial [Sphingobacteriaceae bacterium]|nr:hypothetical protein [Cytophagaceae bacterium]
KCPYPTELLLLRFTTLPDSATHKIESLVFSEAWYEQSPINIPETFAAFQQPNRDTTKLKTLPKAYNAKAELFKKQPLQSGDLRAIKSDLSTLRFSFLKTPFTLLLVSQDTVPATKRITSGFHLVDRIETRNDERRYHCKPRHQLRNTARPIPSVTEKLNAIFTF